MATGGGDAQSNFATGMAKRGVSKFGGQANVTRTDREGGKVEEGRFADMTQSEVKDRFVARLKVCAA